MNDLEQFVCEDCDHDRPLSDSHELSVGRRVCDLCWDNYVKCKSCDGDILTQDSLPTECCYVVCTACASRDYTYSEIQRCYISDESTVTLADTGVVVSVAWAESNAYLGRDGCWYQEDPRRSAPIFDFDENVLKWCEYDRAALKRGALVFGVELEMEPTSGYDQRDVVEALEGRLNKRYILKEDQSLTDGVELVTVPLSLDDHRTRFGWDRTLAPVLNYAKSGVDTENCGMHVHINAAALSDLQVGKILVFLNSEKLRDHITVIAQREANSYCARRVKKITDGCEFSEDRHDVVNVTARTVEIRMFRGNLRVQRIFKNLEFCHALVLYCRDSSLNAIERWDEFSSWLLRRRSQYPNLVRFLAAQKQPGFGHLTGSRDGHVEEQITCA